VWAIEQVVALAGSAARFGAAEAVAVPSRWSRTGASDRGVWGRYHGSASEPYDVAVDHVAVAERCTCPSRARPCKHAVALLVLWVRGHVPDVPEPKTVSGWIDRLRRVAEREAADATPAPSTGDGAPVGRDEPPPAEQQPGTETPQPGRDERIEKLRAGLVELDRWLEDRVRTGLADPAVARYATWDELARRLTDARAGALANRVRRLAGRVGAEAGWQEHVLAEIGVLHLLAQAGQRVGRLPSDLADGVAVACGWQVRRADVESAAPVTDRWLVAGRSDTREDLVEVRRVWLLGIDSGSWAMILSFAAYRQSLDDSLVIGTIVDGDLHRYPGSAHRALVGACSGVDSDRASAHAAAVDAAATTADACRVVGDALAVEPWLERVPAIVTGAVTRSDGEWLITDESGSLPIAPEAARSDAVATFLAASGGRPITVAIEWTARGFFPLTAFLDDRAIDIGPRADPSFVSAA
jgi:SWIM zinc finger